MAECEDICRAWLLDPDLTDLRAAGHCVPDVPVSLSELESLGVFVRRVEVAALHVPHPDDDAGRTLAQRLAWHLGYAAQETLPLSSADGEDAEHLNTDEQMRGVTSGVVFLDLRDASDRWVRVEARAGLLATLPAGLHHRLLPPAHAPPATLLRLMRRAAVFAPSLRGSAETPESAAARADYAHFLAHPPTDTVLGPADGADNVLVPSPRGFDAALARAKAGMRAGDVLVLLFKGPSDRKTHVSWCPPCVEAEPMVRRAVQAARQKSTHRVVLVQCLLERSVYLGNPEHPYRTHPFVGIVTIPYLIVLKRGETDLVELRRERDPGERYESWVDEI